MLERSHDDRCCPHPFSSLCLREIILLTLSIIIMRIILLFPSVVGYPICWISWTRVSVPRMDKETCRTYVVGRRYYPNFVVMTTATDTIMQMFCTWQRVLSAYGYGCSRYCTRWDKVLKLRFWKKPFWLLTRIEPTLELEWSGVTAFASIMVSPLKSCRALFGPLRCSQKP